MYRPGDTEVDVYAATEAEWAPIIDAVVADEQPKYQREREMFACLNVLVGKLSFCAPEVVHRHLVDKGYAPSERHPVNVAVMRVLDRKHGGDFAKRVTG